MAETPTYLIVPGTHKSGTTSLYTYLGDHPRCFAPLKKELHHFTGIVYDQPISSIDDYLKHFNDAEEGTIRMDFSPSYFYGGQPMIDALRSLGDVRVLVLLRDPAKRFVSFYKQGIKAGRIPGDETLETFFTKAQASFDRFIQDGKHEDNFYNRSLREGCYGLYLEPWIEAFGDKLKIVYFESLTQLPRETLKDVCDWLSIEDIYEDYNFTVQNQSFKPKSQRFGVLASKIFLKNEKFFRRNARLKNFLKRLYTKANNTNYDAVNQHDLDRIRAFYAPNNTAFHDLLEKHNLNKPSW